MKWFQTVSDSSFLNVMICCSYRQFQTNDFHTSLISRLIETILYSFDNEINHLCRLNLIQTFTLPLHTPLFSLSLISSSLHLPLPLMPRANKLSFLMPGSQITQFPVWPCIIHKAAGRWPCAHLIPQIVAGALVLSSPALLFPFIALRFSGFLSLFFSNRLKEGRWVSARMNC